ncbi:MAG TPA: hypothetical protein VFN23_10160 [Ktedonobacteraceae bacterium]|nr:hypothetical protein [Ktedonobacteraceae bacterium]
MQPNSDYPPNTGPYAELSEADKKKRLDALVRVWQRDSERKFERDGYRSTITTLGLDEYRYAVALRFPEWERSAVVGQVVTLKRSASGSPEDPAIFSLWRRESFLKRLPDWKQNLPNENMFNINVRMTPGGLGEGTKWEVAMPKDLIPRYKPGWPTQKEWVAWTGSFDWVFVAVGFIRAMLDSLDNEQQRS